MAWMDALRGSMVLLVILYHAGGRVRRYEPGSLEYVTFFNDFFEPFRMPVLVMLSGILLTRSMAKSRTKYVEGKVRQLLWPYLVWSVIFIVLLDATGAGSNDAPLWLQLAEIATGTATYLWFLSFLFAYYMISLVTPARLREVGILVSIALTVPLMTSSDLYELRKFFFLLAFFWLGDMIGRKGILQSPRLNGRFLLAVSIAVAVGTGLASSFGLVSRYEPLTLFGALGAAIALISAARAIDRTGAEKVLVRIGASTIVYYTSHFVVIAVAYFVLARFVGLDHPDALFATLVASALLCGWLLDFLRKKLVVVDWLFVMPWPKSKTKTKHMTS